MSKGESTLPALPTGLTRHKNGTYYLRRRIPADLLSFYDGKKEIGESLNTKNYKDAVERFYVRDAQIQTDWREKRQRFVDIQVARELRGLEVLRELSEDDIKRITDQFEAESLAGDEQRREKGHYQLDDIHEYQGAYSDVLPLLKAAVAVGDIRIVAPALSQFLYLHNYDNQLSEHDFRRLALAYARASIRVNEQLLRRYEGEDVPTPSGVKASALRLSELARDYITKYDASNKLAMTKKVRLVIPMLVELTGNKPISAIKQSDINRFFELVHDLPPRWSDLSRQKKQSWVEIAKQKLGEIAPGTFEDTYKAVIRRFLDWAITNYQDRGFPTTLTTKLIEYDGSRKGGENHQRAFSTTELARLLTGPEMRKMAENPEDNHKFWLPHLGLFTGARVNELCQLHPEHDILQDSESKVWYLRITTEGEEVEGVRKSVKTPGSVRLVPLHSELVRLGFLDFVRRQVRSKQKLLFSPFRPSRDKASGEAEKWFREFLRETGVRDETPGAKITGMHAFRSTIMNRAMNQRVQGVEAITGHAHNSKETARQEKETQVSPVVKKYQGEMAVASKSVILEQIGWPDLKLIKPCG